MGLKGGVNRYIYGFDNPIMQFDVFGLQSQTPSWDKEYWDDWNRRTKTNCYGYARNIPGSHWNPGDQYYENPIFKPTCKNQIEGAKKDGMIDPKEKGTCGGECPEGYYKVQVYLDDSWWNTDFHWYRQDSGGGWSHKQGTGWVDNTDATGAPIYCPSTQSRDYSKYGGRNYSEYCGTLCAPF